MKTFDKQCAQGDVLFTRISELPETNLEPIGTENGMLIITHSETGHHHVMSPQAVQAFRAINNPLVLFIKVEEPTELEHLREEHTHESIMFEPGIYQVNKQREWTPEGYRLALD